MSARTSVLVLGATGFVGRNLLQRLEGTPWDLHALIRPDRCLDAVELMARHKAVNWVDASRGIQAAVQTVAGSGPIDVVIHLAGRINGASAELARDNVGITRQLLSSLDAVGARPRIVYLSSVSAVKPLGRYGEEKRAAEDAIANWSANSVALRSSLIYGPSDTKNVAKLVDAVRRWPVIPVPGGQSVVLQPLYVGDLCEAILRSAVETGVTGPLIVAGPAQERLWDMIRIIQRVLARKQLLIPVSLAPVQWAGSVLARLFPRLPLPLQQINSLHRHAPWSSEQARQSIGFSPMIFADGIAQYLGLSR